MTPEKQRIAIAQACGWSARLWASGTWQSYSPNGENTTGGYGSKESCLLDSVPDYLNDLNACHEMEKVLTDWDDKNQCKRYVQLLDYDERRSEFGLVHADAKTRCEAFLKTIGKWEEDVQTEGQSSSSDNTTNTK